VIRYVISFPAGTNVRPEQMQYFREYISKAASAREWKDVIISQGGTITDMRPRVPVHIKHAQRRLR
jgi:hypothetical protein